MRLNLDNADVYTTADMALSCTLWALGYRVLRGGIRKDINGKIHCSFSLPDVEEIVKMWNEGRPIVVSIHDMWYAYSIFRSALYKRDDGTSKDKMTVVSLMALGHKVEEGGVWKDGNMVVYDFNDDDAQDDARAFVEMEDIEVNASDFWNAINQFKSNIRNV